MAAARRAGIPALSRAEMLAAVCASGTSIGVAGTHGKTTTTTLVSLMLGGTEGKCGFVVGGDAPGLQTNGTWSPTGLFVVEADESDGTHEALPLRGAIITNIDTDHLDHFGSFTNIVNSFSRFAQGINGPVALCIDDAELRKISSLLQAEGREVLTYGVQGKNADIGIAASNIEATASGMTFFVHIAPNILEKYQGQRRFVVNLRARGMHNVLNALGALAIALRFGATQEEVTQVLGEFQGVARRFDIQSETDGITLIDDYAHLPAEISATIHAVRSHPALTGRVVAVFQPNRYHRIATMADSYADCFARADRIVITDVYASGTQKIEGVTGELVVNAIRNAHHDAEVVWAPSRADTVAAVESLIAPGDICVSMGCGDIESFPDDLRGVLR